MELSQYEFDLFRNYIHEICGIALGRDKQYLIRNRLGPVAVSGGYHSFLEYYHALQKDLIPNGRNDVLSAITTNETSFMRDKHLFDAYFSHVLPYLTNKPRLEKTKSLLSNTPKISIWSAGASTGQEAYSIAMLINEYICSKPSLGLSNRDFGILATDVSSRALAKGSNGEYSDIEISKGLSDNLKRKYFHQTEKGTWHIVAYIRQMVEFRNANLIKPFALFKDFDVIFCRNVLCYFDNNTKQTVFDHLYKSLADDGFLFIGATESVYPITDKFKPVRLAGTQFYRKQNQIEI